MFYTYLWLRYDGTPYYVGKGKGVRAFYRSGRVVRPPLDKSRIILQEFSSEEDAFIAEKFLIGYFGRLDLGHGILRNRTDGGEGHSNPPMETRLWGNAYALGRHQTESAKEKIRLSKLGVPRSVEARNRLSVARRTTHCKWGHFLEGNVYLSKKPSGRMGRSCKICVQENGKLRYALNKRKTENPISAGIWRSG